MPRELKKHMKTTPILNARIERTSRARRSRTRNRISQGFKIGKPLCPLPRCRRTPHLFQFHDDDYKRQNTAQIARRRAGALIPQSIFFQYLLYVTILLSQKHSLQFSFLKAGGHAISKAVTRRLTRRILSPRVGKTAGNVINAYTIWPIVTFLKKYEIIQSVVYSLLELGKKRFYFPLPTAVVLSFLCISLQKHVLICTAGALYASIPLLGAISSGFRRPECDKPYCS